MSLGDGEKREELLLLVNGGVLGREGPRELVTPEVKLVLEDGVLVIAPNIIPLPRELALVLLGSFPKLMSGSVLVLVMGEGARSWEEVRDFPLGWSILK